MTDEKKLPEAEVHGGGFSKGRADGRINEDRGQAAGLGRRGRRTGRRDRPRARLR